MNIVETMERQKANRKSTKDSMNIVETMERQKDNWK